MESLDHSNRLTIGLSDDDWCFDYYANKIVEIGGWPVQRLDHLDTRYWDFQFGKITVTLHSSMWVGVNVFCEGRQDDELLRTVASRMLSAAGNQTV